MYMKVYGSMFLRMPLQYVTSQKGAKLLIIDGYTYRKDNTINLSIGGAQNKKMVIPQKLLRMMKKY